MLLDIIAAYAVSRTGIIASLGRLPAVAMLPASLDPTDAS